MKKEKVKLTPEQKSAKRKIGWLITASILCAIFVFVGTLYIANALCVKSLINYVRSFEAVDYTSQLEPTTTTIDNHDYCTFVTDNDLKVMFLTDIHIGGGISTTKKDRKAIYELISMLQQEKPDLVILGGDNIFAVPGPIFNGGGTLNNKMVSKVILEIFEHEHVYFSTVFGNHDTEVFDYTNRQDLAKLYMSENYKYCLFQQDFTDADAKNPSVTNQCILVKNTSGDITKALMLTDTNAYVDNSISAVLDWKYDTIHDAQVDWAYDTLSALKTANGGNTVKSLFFFHIPISEYQMAYNDLKANNFADTATTKYISGAWDEEFNDELNTRVWYGGVYNQDTPLAELDKLFERIHGELDSLEACICGHDHTNNATVVYDGVTLCYGNSLDNTAYNHIYESGKQRGSTIITISPNANEKATIEKKNVYNDYEIDQNKFYSVDNENFYNNDIVEPTNR